MRLAPTTMTDSRSMGGKMGRAAQPSLNSVSAFAVPELPNRYLQPQSHPLRQLQARIQNSAPGDCTKITRASQLMQHCSKRLPADQLSQSAEAALLQGAASTSTEPAS